MESQPQLGNVIRRLRLAKRYSQETLAEAAEIHRNFLSEIERGSKGISLETLFRLSRALGVRAETIVEEINEHR